MHDRERAHRARAEGEQREARDQRRHVRIENRRPRVRVAFLDRDLRRRAAAQFLADALVDQHVRVDRHAERERDGRDAGQRERRLHQRQHRDEQQQVHRQAEHRYDAEQHVVRDHEHGDRDEAPDHRMEAHPDVVRAEARADRAFLDDVHRRGERARAQQQREIGGRLRGRLARDLEAVAELRLDRRDGQHFALALLEQHHRHRLADVLARHRAHRAAARRIEADVHGRTLMLVEARGRVDDAVAREDHLLLEQHRRLVALREQFLARRHRIVRIRVRVQRIGEARLERRGAADDVLRLRGVLHARQLDDDPVVALLLEDRLGHAEFVDAVVQRRQVLLERRFLDGLLDGRRERADDLIAAAARLRRPLEFGDGRGEQLARLLGGVLVGEVRDDRLIDAGDAAVANALVAQLRAGVGRVGIELLRECARHVDLQQEVDAAAQIEAEIHRQRVQRGQPARRRALQVQRDDVLRIVRIGVQRLLQHVLHAQLRVGVLQAHADGRVGAGIVERDVVGRDLVGLERCFDLRERVGAELDRGLAARYLHRRRFAEEVGQCVQKADGERHDHHHIFPDWITIHEGAERDGWLEWRRVRRRPRPRASRRGRRAAGRAAGLTAT
ncbi:Uncharacterised protein [Burkholderia pseudomallei]|nr:Uncharacterised protein [Burkholderia pseudomallei]